MEQSVIHPDADAGTQYRDNKGADAAGGMDADEAEQELAHKAAQNAQHDVAAGGGLGAHKAVGDVTGQSAYQHAHEQGSQQADQREQAHQHAHQSADQGKDNQDRQSDHTEASLVSFVGTAFSAAYRQMSFRQHFSHSGLRALQTARPCITKRWHRSLPSSGGMIFHRAISTFCGSLMPSTSPILLHSRMQWVSVTMAGLQNDLSFVVDFDLWFFEHQSTLNPNMPYRFLLYLASEYSKLNTDDLLYSNKLQMLDTPHFVVFYNGTDPLPEYSTLKLSSAYRNKEEAPQLELQVQVININLGFNAELMDACQILKEYAQFVAEVRKQAKVYPNRQAIVQAVDVCIRRDILKEFLLENKKEVIDMVFFEYDAEAEKRVIYKDGKIEGKAEEIVRLCKKFHVSKEDTIRELETELSISTQAAMDYYDNFSKELEGKSLDDQKAL